METRLTKAEMIQACLKLSPDLAKFSVKNIWGRL